MYRYFKDCKTTADCYREYSLIVDALVLKEVPDLSGKLLALKAARDNRISLIIDVMYEEIKSQVVKTAWTAGLDEF